MTKLRVVLNATLKRFDGSLFTHGTVFNGTMSELPEEIRLAVERNKRYVEVTEVPEFLNGFVPSDDTTIQMLKNGVLENIPEITGGFPMPEIEALSPVEEVDTLIPAESNAAPIPELSADVLDAPVAEKKVKPLAKPKRSLVKK